MEKKFIYQKLCDSTFMIENINLIDGISIGGLCHETSPCQHNICLHLKTSPENEWILFESLVSGHMTLFVWDLLNDEHKEHFSYLFKRNEHKNIPGQIFKYNFERVETIHKEKISEKNKIIDSLREEIKELNQEIVYLKFKPNGKGYQEAKNNFERLATFQK